MQLIINREQENCKTTTARGKTSESFLNRFFKTNCSKEPIYGIESDPFSSWNQAGIRVGK